MNVAVLYLDKGPMSDDYPDDHEGRDGVDTINAVSEVLKGLGHDVTMVNMDLDAFERLRHMKVDVAFNLCDDGFHNETWMESHIVAMLDILRIPYTGSNHKAFTICQDKAHAKKIFLHHGLPTPPFYVAENLGDLDHDLDYPLIVKPSREDGSIGIKYDAVAEDLEGLRQRISRVLETYKQPALVEEFICGREFSVSLLGNANPRTLPVSEIKFHGLPENQRIVSYSAKWVSESSLYKATTPECPAKIKNKLSNDLKELALRAYKIIGVEGYGRVDFRVNEDGPQLLEVNPNPDISVDAGLPRSARAAGLSYEQLIEKILEYAVAK
jgi:D-alanine-D-alanine ligase